MQWTVPINATLSQLLKIGGQPLQLQLGYRYYAEAPTNGPDWGFREALAGGIQAAVELVKFIVQVVIALSPLWLLGIVLFFVIRWRVRARRARAAGVTKAEGDA